MNELDKVLELDEAIVDISRDIKILSELAWPPALQAVFIDSWRRGQPQLPDVTYPFVDRSNNLRKLDSITRQASKLEHPLAEYVTKTAQSYLTISQLLVQRGKPEMTSLSVQVYGRPGESLTGGNGVTSLDAARYFLKVASEFDRNHHAAEAEFCLLPRVIKQEVQARLIEVFEPDRIRVEIDKNLTSKAVAGATRIRLRDATCFSEYDAEQLLQHEAFVHSLTALNGRSQPHLKSLSLGAPRTTAAQEGLATFAELVTGAIDIARLERIAMRIVAIDLALSGANFIDVFRYFLEAGQPEMESYNSTVRVFRGAPVTGGHAFTKDSVYLHGLLEVHTFFRWALREQKLKLCEHFFAGRMTLCDVIRFEPYFADGTIRTASYLPPWITRTTGLGGYLAFSVFANNIDLSGLYASHNFELLDR